MKKNRKIFYLLSVLLILFPSILPVHAYEGEGESEIGDRTAAPYFLIENGDPALDRFPLKDTDVSVTISGTIAETYVTQTYINEGQKPINASYLFPASTKVAVHGMKMTIGDQVVTALIQEKEEAEETFEKAKSEGKSASLLTQERPNVFSMDVANIMPGDTVSIELHYTELIVPSENIYQFVFPTVVGPRYTSQIPSLETQSFEWVETPYIPEGGAAPGTYNITVNLSAGVPISLLNCQSHETSVVWSDTSTARVSLADSSGFAGNRDYILDYKLTGEEIQYGLMLDSSEDEHYFMLTVQPPERFEPRELPSREYIFILDVSGSMYDFPLDTAKLLLKNQIQYLKETDYFNLILFSGASIRLSQSSLPATAENIEKAIDLIDRGNGGGGTELAPALQSALDIPKPSDSGSKKINANISRNIIIITDGYISAESAIFDLISGSLDQANFFSFGIGSSVNRYLIEGIARAGQGESFVVTDPSEAAAVAGQFRTYIEAPILTDIQVTFDGFDTYDVEPRLFPTLFAQKPLVLFGKWRGEPTGSIRITGRRGNEDYRQTIHVDEVVQSESNNALRYLWARTRIDRLTDYGANPDKPEVQQEVTNLGLNYSMMTPYTSFVAVLETIRNPEAESTDVDQPNPLPLHVSNLALGYTIGSEPGDLLLILGIVLMITTGSLRFLRRTKRKTV